MDGKLSQRATPNRPVELLVSLAILWRWQRRATALRLPNKRCQHYEGRAQHFSRQSIGPEGVLATTRLEPFGRKISSRTREDDYRSRLRLALFRHAFRLLRLSRSFLLDAALRCEINGKTPEPVSTLVMRSGNCCQTGALMRVCRSLQRGPAPIIRWQRRQNSFQHPGATQV